MTKEEILAMKSGRILDAIIGEKVMGLDLVEERLPQLPKHYLPEYERTIFQDVPLYSTDISAAWEVFNKFDFPIFEKGHDEDGNDYFVCKISPQYVIADTAELAICRAALLAVMHP